MKFNEVLNELKIYEAGKPIELVVREYGVKPEDIIKLASNENPYGVSPKVSEVIKNYVNAMSIYPDDSFYELKEALANKFKLESKNVVIGAGSDQVIEFCVRAKADKGSNVLMAKTTFAMYEIYAKQIGANIIRTESDMHNLDEFRELYKQNGADIIFLCLPNNPLGECLDREDVYKFISEVDSDTMVVVDGAYQEYASYKDEAKKIEPHDLIEKFPNAIYLGTFSKAYSLGGMRVGYGLAKSEIIEALHKLRPPFNITTLSLKSAIEVLKDEEFVKKSIEKNFLEMERYIEFAKDKNIKYIESYTNFITLLLDESISSSEFSQILLKQGIIVRNLSSYGVNAIRITIGTKSQNDRVLQKLNELL